MIINSDETIHEYVAGELQKNTRLTENQRKAMRNICLGLRRERTEYEYAHGLYEKEPFGTGTRYDSAGETFVFHAATVGTNVEIVN